jgi:S1-C subfamily serine protease
VDADEGFEDEGPFSAWVPPDDRLWRHPSETAASAGAAHFVTPAATARGAKGYSTRTWTTALIAGLVGALLASGIGAATGVFGDTTVVRPYATLVSPTASTTKTVAAGATSWSNIYAQLAPSMVMISGDSDAGAVSASGMLWETDYTTAYILSADAALEGVGSVSVAFAGGYTADGRVIGTDAQTGLAVISVAERLLPAGIFPDFPTLGSLTDVSVGDPLATVGSGTESNGSFVTASVSSLDREVTDTDDGLVMLGMIAVANAGPVNYGTAVVDASGDVVGLTVEGGTSDNSPQLVSYALPIDVASAVATQLVNGEKPWHPWIGVLQASDLPSGTARQMNLPGGAEVDAISPGSPADNAGLSPQDVIVSLANTPINSTGSLLDALSGCNRNSRVSLRYLHQGKPVNTSILVTAQPANP